MSEHVTPKRTYFTIFGALLVLTAITVAVSFFDLGIFSNIVALGIASTKAALVIFFFMELRHAPALTKLALASGLAWLAIFLVLLGADYASRGWLAHPTGW